MKKTPKPEPAFSLACMECPWTYVGERGENSDAISKYHRIQVHNDQNVLRNVRVY